MKRWQAGVVFLNVATSYVIRSRYVSCIPHVCACLHHLMCIHAFLSFFHEQIETFPGGGLVNMERQFVPPIRVDGHWFEPIDVNGTSSTHTGLS